MYPSDWYALQVRPNCEKAVADALDRRAVERYLPTYREDSRWSDRIVSLDRPLFPGYLFARFELSEAARISRIANVLSILGAGNDPVPVSEAEIETVRALLASGYPIQPWYGLGTGEEVEIDSGAFRGLRGTVLRTKRDAAVVIVSVLGLLGRSAAVEFPCYVIHPTRRIAA